MAASMGKQSPVIVQFSYNSNIKVGGDPNTIWAPEGIYYSANAVVNGAKTNADWIAMEAEAWGADYVAVSLDHFKVPKFEPGKQYQTNATPLDYPVQVTEAMDFLRSSGLDRIADEVDDAAFQSYVNYLTSTEYQGFRADFMETVSIMDPAWGMIDTEGIPFVLDFAITKDFVMGVRVGLGNADMMMEAELGATGSSGDDIAYEPMRGAELDEFAALAAAFIDFTGAEGMAYDIGMKHAARAGETHPADEEKLETVQRTIIEKAGVYAAYAQHGGTGAAEVARGLVGKTNVNTAFLVAGSVARAQHFADNAEKVQTGDKNICGTNVETHIYLEALYNVCVERYQTTGSYETGDQVAEFLAQ